MHAEKPSESGAASGQASTVSTYQAARRSSALLSGSLTVPSKLTGTPSSTSVPVACEVISAEGSALVALTPVSLVQAVRIREVATSERRGQ